MNHRLLLLPAQLLAAPWLAALWLAALASSQR